MSNEALNTSVSIITNLQWKPSKSTLFGLPCLVHSVTGELAAFGKRGQLFAYSDSEAAAIIYLNDGEHINVPIRANEVDFWKERLKIPSRGQTQFVR